MKSKSFEYILIILMKFE